MTIDTRRRRLLAAAAGTTTLVGLSGCTAATPFVGKRIETTRTFEFDADSTVAVDATNGDVTVRRTDADAVRLETVKKSGSVFADLSNVSVDVTREDDTLTVETSYDGDGTLFGGRPSVDVTLELPPGPSIDAIRTENGDVDVRDVDGDATLTSRNGDVTARDVAGTLALETENGDATARNVAGFVAAETENGDVDVRGVDGVDAARSTNGNVDVDVPAVRGDVRIETDNGDVDASVSPDVDARLVLETDLGDADLVGPFDVSTDTEGYVEAGPEDADYEVRFVSDTGDVSVSRLN